MTAKQILSLFLAAAAARAGAVGAEMRLPALFGDHMVLQRGRPVPVWGWAGPGEEVTVAFAGQTVRATAGADGRWQTRLAPLEASAEPGTLSVSGRTGTLAFGDVLVGEVWLCSGQSNMAMSLGLSRDARAEIAAAAYPDIRMFTVPQRSAGEPRVELAAQWASCTPSTAGRFSAAAYFFGRQLHRELGLPVGLVHASVGGTAAESWMSPGILAATREHTPAFSTWEGLLADWSLGDLYPEPRHNVYAYDLAAEKALTDLLARARAARAEGRDVPAGETRLALGHQALRQAFKDNAPSGFFNGMISPLIPYALRGAIWYQGESNVPNPEGYRALLPALITDWRAHWGQGDFPFLVVGLANFRPRKDAPGDSDWARLREAQFLTAQTLPGVGFANTIDIGEAGDIHPKNKQEVGRRLALVALALVYGREIESSGPAFRALDITPAGARVRFDHARDGLVTADGQPARGFTIAGADGYWRLAQATLEGDSALLACPAVPAPVAVRYAWADNPDANLGNRAGLPAVPFRTDDWSRAAERDRARADNPVLRIAERDPAGLTLDGRLDEPFWADLPEMELRASRPDREPADRTLFRAAWAENALYLGVTCLDRDMANLRITAIADGDRLIWQGDNLEILVETQTSSYYQVAISPVGALVDLDRSRGMDFNWSSGARAAVHRDAGAWSAEIRLPLAGAPGEAGLAGEKPDASGPWFFKVCRQRVREDGSETSSFPASPGGFHEPLSFAGLHR